MGSKFPQPPPKDTPNKPKSPPPPPPPRIKLPSSEVIYKVIIARSDQINNEDQHTPKEKRYGGF